MMTRKMNLFVVFVAASFLALSGCPKKTDLSSIPEAQNIEPAPVPDAETKPQAKEETEERAGAPSVGLRSIYYDFDSSVIREEARSIMQTNAAWLKANPAVKIRIEGNCDERGTREYNQALGQQRANSAKRYLTDLGISSTRISLISYGKEKQICTETTDDCWQKNRRGDFVASE